VVIVSVSDVVVGTTSTGAEVSVAEVVGSDGVSDDEWSHSWVLVAASEVVVGTTRTGALDGGCGGRASEDEKSHSVVLVSAAELVVVTARTGALVGGDGVSEVEKSHSSVLVAASGVVVATRTGVLDGGGGGASDDVKSHSVVLVSGGGAVVDSTSTGLDVSVAEEVYSHSVELATTLTGQFGEGISSSVVTSTRLETKSANRTNRKIRLGNGGEGGILRTSKPVLILPVDYKTSSTNKTHVAGIKT